MRTFLDCGVGDSTWRICDISGKLRPLNYRVHCTRWFILILCIVCQMISILAYLFKFPFILKYCCEMRDENWMSDFSKCRTMITRRHPSNSVRCHANVNKPLSFCGVGSPQKTQQRNSAISDAAYENAHFVRIV